jgi:hypothetical protein
LQLVLIQSLLVVVALVLLVHQTKEPKATIQLLLQQLQLPKAAVEVVHKATQLAALVVQVAVAVGEHQALRELAERWAQDQQAILSHKTLAVMEMLQTAVVAAVVQVVRVAILLLAQLAALVVLAQMLIQLGQPLQAAA